MYRLVEKELCQCIWDESRRGTQARLLDCYCIYILCWYKYLKLCTIVCQIKVVADTAHHTLGGSYCTKDFFVQA
jgi:hypothetical protein